MDEKKSIDGFRVQPGGTEVPVSRPIAVQDADTDKTLGDVTDIQPEEPSAPVEAQSEPSAEPQSEPAEPTDTPEPTFVSDKTESEVLRRKNKRLKVWLVVLLMLLTAVIAGLGVYFMQARKAQDDLDAAQAQNQQLQQQINEQNATKASQQISSLQSQVSDLTSDNKTLTSQNEALVKQVNTLNTYITQLTATATKLKTTCGSACSSITIPPAPTSSTTDTSTSN